MVWRWGGGGWGVQARGSSMRDESESDVLGVAKVDQMHVRGCFGIDMIEGNRDAKVDQLYVMGRCLQYAPYRYWTPL